uniref:Uncharacterized protein n=1 Tax=Haptolina brevifila TaxID=156173 RepID=A0A7S2DFZ3_9EUKA|mmetsp:Transcript_3792/g.8265  ORF Transcript_3792/g.8265 Transcript_3792/m.8265 type:complete len:223 (+) Transcript_3792:693-1361(+)
MNRPDVLAPSVAMHVRMGDGAFFRNSTVAAQMAKAKIWAPFVFEWRRNIFSLGHAQRAMECLAVASDAKSAAAPKARAASSSQVPSSDAPTCWPCMVIADAREVITCARDAFGPTAILTPGDAIQIVGSDPRQMTWAEVDKTFLDWWVLARSARLLTFGESAFDITAAHFSLASGSTSRLWIRAHNDSEVREDTKWRSICNGSRPQTRHTFKQITTTDDAFW